MITTAMLRIILGLVIVASGGAAFATRNLAFAVVLVVTALLLATGFGRSGTISGRAEVWRGRSVRIQVWNATPSAHEAEPLRLANTWALGAGLHFYIEGALPGRIHIKVAQPHHFEIVGDRLVIHDAKYVQVQGRNMPRTDGTPAFTMEVS